MGYLERRLKRLEAATGTTPTAQDETVRRAVLGRMSDEDLDACEAAIERSEAGEEPTEADRAIAARVEAIREELENEFA